MTVCNKIIIDVSVGQFAKYLFLHFVFSCTDTLATAATTPYCGYRTVSVSYAHYAKLIRFPMKIIIIMISF
jgi:hypothetical protein